MTDSNATIFDLLVVGGGVNGAGIAADAAGRGLKVLLVEADDLASATSSASSKLIHGGLRYLEHGAFGLVRKALSEREVLLRAAPHIVWPMRFLLPQAPGMRPGWMLRIGLFLYDHLGKRERVPGSGPVRLSDDPSGRALKDAYGKGFEYWDCWVDDARLVVANTMQAAEKGADIRTRTTLTSARAGENGLWLADLRDGRDGTVRTVAARAMVNAAGPWAARLFADLRGNDGTPPAPPKLRLVKGSHIIVPRIAGADDAFILQNDDGRVVFALPYEERFTLIGTTDISYEGDPRGLAISDDETDYLIAAAGRYFDRAPKASDVVWRYSGVRPLFDDADMGGAKLAQRVSRDYRLDLANGTSVPPLLTVLGGKITTFRPLAEAAMTKLQPLFPGMGPSWTADAPLPGGEIAGADFDAFMAVLERDRPTFEARLLHRLARRHGARIDRVLGDAKTPQDLGRHIGAGLYEREVSYLKAHEWAVTPEDVLWRRTKVGLHLSADERAQAAAAIEGIS